MKVDTGFELSARQRFLQRPYLIFASKPKLAERHARKRKLSNNRDNFEASALIPSSFPLPCYSWES